MNDLFRAAVLVSLYCLLLSSCDQQTNEQAHKSATPINASAEYVSSSACKECHADAYQQWRNSHHDLAMQAATDETVLGDFNNVQYEQNGVTSRFFKRDDQFFVHTDNAAGEMQDFKISYAFGVQPLQQYLIDFPDGRKQALSIAWDTRPKEKGGQRWFHLYGDDNIEHSDPLHWTRLNQNWNYQCADCHSTELEKNYNSTTGHYATSWAEVTVGCEACHGPASQHLTWAQTENKTENVPHKGFATDLSDSRHQINGCAHCHARRSIIAEGFTPDKPLLDYYQPALLDAGLYHNDGQILDEVYVYGSFLQSKMYDKGVTCTDCHNAHSAELKASGNAVCTQCHQSNPPAKFPSLQKKSYDASAHHFHEPDSAGAQCVACHMPTKTYMQVDDRHDHGFRLPRPDLSAELGTPNTCNTCHADQSADWAATQIEQRFGKQRAPHFASTFADARENTTDVSADLLQIAVTSDQPGIVRATAYSLVNVNSPAAMQQLSSGLQDSDPLVRIGATRATEGLDINSRWQLLAPLLDDPLRAVRGEAAHLLAPVLNEQIEPPQRASLQKAVDEYIAAQLLNADRPEAQTNLGLIYAQTNQPGKVEPAYRRAITLDPSWVPAYINLADFMRAQDRDGEGEPLLKKVVHMQPNNAEIRQAYGLWLTRQGRSEEALRNLKASATLTPQNSRYAYIY
ncbi:MAG: multiheme c-type cytochrome, partial [Pseudomonadales bacterium]